MVFSNCDEQVRGNKVSIPLCSSPHRMTQESITALLLVLLVSGCEEKETERASAAAPIAESVPSTPSAPAPKVTEMSLQEMDTFRKKQQQDAIENKRRIDSLQEAARSQFTEKEMKVYHFMKDRWTAFANSSSGYDPDRHDDLVLTEVATKFGISKAEAETIYAQVDGAGLQQW